MDCWSCGPTVEILPWAEGKCQLTTTYRWFLAGWAKRLSWKEVAEVFDTTWQNVCRSVEMAVDWGLAHRDLKGIVAIGIDEIQWRLGPTPAAFPDVRGGQGRPGPEWGSPSVGEHFPGATCLNEPLTHCPAFDQLESGSK